MSDPRLIDMEPGGESTQYESIRLYTQSPSKQTGQLGGKLEHTKSEPSMGLASDETDNGNAAEEENRAQKLGNGDLPKDTADKGRKVDTPDSDAATTKIRRLQGYGAGSGVGA